MGWGAGEGEYRGFSEGKLGKGIKYLIKNLKNIMDGTSKTVSQPLLNDVPFKSCFGHGVSSQQLNSK